MSQPDSVARLVTSLAGSLLGPGTEHEALPASQVYLDTTAGADSVLLVLSVPGSDGHPAVFTDTVPARPTQDEVLAALREMLTSAEHAYRLPDGSLPGRA